jgi:hypothetical protein
MTTLILRGSPLTPALSPQGHGEWEVTRLVHRGGVLVRHIITAQERR